MRVFAEPPNPCHSPANSPSAAPYRQTPLRRTLVRVVILVFGTLASTLSHAAERPIFAPANVLSNPAADPSWSELFAELSKPSNRYSKFEERRYFPFREKPVLLKGEIRIAPKRGLSLSYSGDKPYVVIIDQTGVLMRDERGRERSAPDDSRARAVISALSHVLRFDLAELEKQFVVHGMRQGEEWTLGFAPKDPNLANSLGSIIVQGQQTRLERIEIVKSDEQRIEITLSDSQSDVIFTMDVLQRFFR